LVLERFEMNLRLEEMKCIACGKVSEIPRLRETKICDDCLEQRFVEDEHKEKVRQYKSYLEASRIPVRYWNFDITNLEIDETTFNRMVLTPDSILISGEIGTGKTNLACQLLIQSRGRFYTINEMYQIHATRFDWIKQDSLICIDDISKTAFAKVSDKIFDLVNYRYNNNKKTIITTDKRLEELEIVLGNEYGSAIVSRIREWCVHKIHLKKKWR